MIAVAGLVASGKSTLARALARRLGAVHLEADAECDALLEERPAPVYEAQWEQAFAPGFEDRVYEALLRRAETAVAEGHSVVLDACFPRADQRLAARALARRHGAGFLLVVCRAPASAVRARLAGRDRRARREGWQALSERVAARWEPVASLAKDEIARVDGDGPVETVVARVLATPLFERRGRPTPLSTASPRAVTFDCWNTLLYEDDWETAHARRVGELRACAREAGRAVDAAEAGRAFDRAWGRHMELWRGGVASGAREVALWGLAELGLDAPHPALDHLVTLFEEASHSGRVLPLDGARALLEGLTGAGVRCALVCDTGLTPGRVVRRHLDRLGLLEFLAAQSFSDEVGVPKPDPRAFRAALTPLGVDPARAWHVGDLRRTDVAGARALGMTAVRIRAQHDDRSALAEADHVVGSHAELGDLLALTRA